MKSRVVLLAAFAMLSTVPVVAQPTITRLRQADGTSQFKLNAAETDIILSKLTNFGSINNNVVSIPVTAIDQAEAADVDVATAAQIQAVGGGATGTAVCFDLTTTGDIIAWDEAFRSGSDQLLRIVPGAPTITVEVALANLDSAGAAGGVEGLSIDANNTFFLHNRFPASGGVRGFLIFPSPTNPATRIEIPSSTVQTALSLTSLPNISVGGLRVINGTGSTKLIWADTANDAIISATFDTSNYATAPVYKIETTNAQIAAHTTQDVSTVSLRALGVDDEGHAYVVTFNASNNAAGPAEAALVRVDMSGLNPSFTTIATQAELLAAANLSDGTPALSIASNSIEVASNGDIFLGNFNGTDDILKIVPSVVTSAAGWNLYH